MTGALYQPFPMLPRGRAQIWRYSPEYRRPRHFHREPELNLVVSGAARFGGGSTSFAVTRGDLLCWPPGYDHELIAASADFDLYVFALTEELSERVLAERSGLALSGPTRVRLPEAALLSLQAGLAAPVITSERSAAEQYIAQLWRTAHDLRLKAPRRGGLGARVLRSLLLRPELDRSERARWVQAHPSELSRSFHRELGLTLGGYRTRLRLLRFIELCDSGRSTLLAAALAAGFGSYSQCHRAFRATFGCAPRAFFETELRHEMADAFATCGASGCVASSCVASGYDAGRACPSRAAERWPLRATEQPAPCAAMTVTTGSEALQGAPSRELSGMRSLRAPERCRPR